MIGRHPVRSGIFTVPFRGEGLSGMHPGNTRSPNYSLMPSMRPRCRASGICSNTRVGCRTIKASMSGGESGTAVMRPVISHGHCFMESGMPGPMIWEGKKGAPSTPAMPFRLKGRRSWTGITSSPIRNAPTLSSARSSLAIRISLRNPRDCDSRTTRQNARLRSVRFLRSAR